MNKPNKSVQSNHNDHNHHHIGDQAADFAAAHNNEQQQQQQLNQDQCLLLGSACAANENQSAMQFKNSMLIQDCNRSSSTASAATTTSSTGSGNHEHDSDNSAKDANDDDAFIAYCADASSVLNSDPTRRCYINKLYKPLNVSTTDLDQTHSPHIIEHDDEYLLYQELKYIEQSSANEITSDRDMVELTNILEDDDCDDEDDVHLRRADRQMLEDPLDRLQLTTIIESFDFDSPLMIDNNDSCQANDSLIDNDVSSTNGQLELADSLVWNNEQQHQHDHSMLHRQEPQTMTDLQQDTSCLQSPNSNQDSEAYPDCGMKRICLLNEGTLTDPSANNNVSSSINQPLDNSDNQHQVNVCEKRVESEYATSITSDVAMDDEELSPDANSSSSAMLNEDCKNPIANKYRRRTANARERIRMREINQAFEKLKKVVPVDLIQQSMSGDESDRTTKSSANKSSSNEPAKLTKITTLRLAVSYIAKLTEVLNQHPGSNATSTSSVQRDSSDNQTKDKSKKSKRAKKSSNRSSENSRSKQPSIQIAKRSKQPIQQQQQTQPLKVSQSEQQNQQTNSPQIQIVQSNLQQQQQQQQQQLLQRQPQQPPQIYNANFGNHQQFMIASQPNGNGQERAFVTPVAVAILGIPSVNNNQKLNEPQNIQLIGLQNATHQLQTAKFLPQQPVVLKPSYGYHLTSGQAQPQQVTLTLNDINGVSVLRLSNPILNNQNNQRTQLQFPITRNHQVFRANNFQVQDNQLQRQPQVISRIDYGQRPIQNSTASQQQYAMIATRSTGQQEATIQKNDNGSVSNFGISGQNCSDHDTTNLQSKCTTENLIQARNVCQMQVQTNTATTTGIDSDQSNHQISQLVANLATSIQRPAQVAQNQLNLQQKQTSQDEGTKQKQHNQMTHHNQPPPLQHHQQHQANQQQQQQRIYRFHNYDGNMITNHLYNNNNSNHDKQVLQQNQSQQQQQSGNGKKLSHATKNNQNSDKSSAGGGQRSRQNSLSSICSSTSSSSSSILSSMSVASNNESPSSQPVVMVKSPAFDSNSSGSGKDETPSSVLLADETAIVGPQHQQQAATTTVGGD